MLYRLISPNWSKNLPTLEGKFSAQELKQYNESGYNIYYFPNYPSQYTKGQSIVSKDIDNFAYVFVDCDLKDKLYESKDEFIAFLKINPKLIPTKIIDSGNGIHAYWLVSDLDAKSYLRFQRRLMRLFCTDPAVGKLAQLMRLPGYNNTKVKEDPKPCVQLEINEAVYTSEQLDKLLPAITLEDEKYCIDHYNTAHILESDEIRLDGKLPPKFGELLMANDEVKQLFSDTSDDRSKGDFRLGHIMLGNRFSKEEAMNVLYNSAKAMQRNHSHRYSYAKNIVDKIWTYEAAPDKSKVSLSPTVREVFARNVNTKAGTRFRCHKLLDDTEYGFRLGQVIGIIGGSGVGKTTLTLNMFLWFTNHNPDYHHFFFSLEQPAIEIAERIRIMCNNDDTLYDRIHIVSNYNDDDTYNHFSMASIEEHILKFEQETKYKVGAIVIDHIGVLDKQTKNGENDGLIGVCREMKRVAVQTKTMMIMLSQAPREKAGSGDLELDKDAAYGTVFFESFVDYCLCLWQPLKRVYSRGAPTIMAFKFAKIRHKKQNKDVIKEDIRYQLFFDPQTELLRELTQEEEDSLKTYMNLAKNERLSDKKSDIVAYVSRRTEEVVEHVTTSNIEIPQRNSRAH